MPVMNTILLNSKNEELKTQEGDPFTVGTGCILALDAALLQDKEEELQKKLRRGKLIEDIEKALRDTSDLRLTAEDLTLIKGRIGQTFTSASVVRKLCQLLDPATE